jgi:hypothetical protein
MGGPSSELHLEPTSLRGRCSLKTTPSWKPHFGRAGRGSKMDPRRVNRLVERARRGEQGVGDGSPGSREAEGEGGEDFYIARSGSSIYSYHRRGRQTTCASALKKRRRKLGFLLLYLADCASYINGALHVTILVRFTPSHHVRGGIHTTTIRRELDLIRRDYLALNPHCSG